MAGFGAPMEFPGGLGLCPGGARGNRARAPNRLLPADPSVQSNRLQSQLRQTEKGQPDLVVIGAGIAGLIGAAAAAR